MQEEYEEEMERVVSFFSLLLLCFYYVFYLFLLLPVVVIITIIIAYFALITMFITVIICMNFTLHSSNLKWEDVLCCRHIFVTRLNHNILGRKQFYCFIVSQKETQFLACLNVGYLY